MALELSTKIPEVKDVIKQVCELSADEKLRREMAEINYLIAKLITKIDFRKKYTAQN